MAEARRQSNDSLARTAFVLWPLAFLSQKSLSFASFSRRHNATPRLTRRRQFWGHLVERRLAVSHACRSYVEFLPVCNNVEAEQSESQPSKQVGTSPFVLADAPDYVKWLGGGGEAADWYMQTLRNLREVSEDEFEGEIRATCAFCQAAQLVPQAKISNPFSGTIAAWEEGALINPDVEEKIFYGLARGVSLDNAENMALSGMCKDLMPEMPLHLASSALDLLALQSQHALYANTELAVFLDNRPIKKGHLIVIPTQHCKDMENFSHDVAGPIFLMLSRFGTAMASAVGADSFWVVAQNAVKPYEGERPENLFKGIDGETTLDESVTHVHFHLLPKYDGEELWTGDETRERFLEPKDAQKIGRLIMADINRIFRA